MAQAGNNYELPEIVLTSKVFRVLNITKKSGHMFFKNLEIGHEVRIEYPLETQYGYRGFNAVYPRLVNLTTGEICERKTLNETLKHFEKTYEVEEVQ